MNTYSCLGQCSCKLLRFCMVCDECSSSGLQRYQELEKTSLIAGKRHSYRNAVVNKKKTELSRNYFVLLSVGILEMIIQAIISNNQVFQIIIDFRYFSMSITVIREL